METSELANLIQTLTSTDESAKSNASSVIARMIPPPEELTQYIAQLGSALKDTNSNVRNNIAYTLVTMGEKGMDISEALPDLIEVLSDTNINIQKEAVWAIVCITEQGNNLGEYEQAFKEKILSHKSIGGNGAIALALHYLILNQEEKAWNVMSMDIQYRRFSVAYAYTIYTLSTGDKSYIHKADSLIKAGLSDQDVIKGIAGALMWYQQLGKDIKIAVDAIHESIADTKEAMREMALNGIFMQMTMKR